MISYAQNAEDVVLARVLPDGHGFYVDVGAGDPSIASVTRHFYDLGWDGINVEPRSEAIARLEADRPRDRNLAVAAGERRGQLSLHVDLRDPDQSTLDPANAERLAAHGDELETRTVEILTLNEILDDHGDREIGFLKIDVEGHEAEVLRGLDLRRHRPAVVLVEAVRPWSTVRTDHEWRGVLEDAGYVEALFDGLNLFFLSPETAARVGPLAPASVLDDFVPASTQELELELGRLREYIGSLEGALDDHRSYLANVEDELGKHQRLQQEATAYTRELEHRLGLIPTGPEVEPAPAAPNRPCRVLVVDGGRRNAGERLADSLADAAGVERITAQHPGDLIWSGLPAEFVLELDWPPSDLLVRLAAQADVTVLATDGTPNGVAWSARPSVTSVRADDVSAQSARELLTELGCVLP